MTPEPDPRLLRALALLLAYPHPELRQELPAIANLVAAEEALDLPLRRALALFVEEMAATPQLDLEERYVALFDRSRGLSLDLFEHIHGEARDRGQAMVDLRALYQRHGLDLAVRELPDHLPVFLEFLSTRPWTEARELLLQVAPILDRLSARLEERESGYGAVLRGLLALCGSAVERSRSPAAETRDGGDDPDDLAALDRAWAEEPVRFGAAAACPAAGGCAHARLGRGLDLPHPKE